MEARSGRDALDGRAVLRGAAVGLALIVPVTIGRVVLEHRGTDFSTSAWVYPLSALILVAYAAAGAVTARSVTARPILHAAVAGLAAVALWVPVRILIWLVREDGRGLLSGERAALPPGQLFGALALGVVIGALGGALVRRGRDRSPDPRVPSGAPS